MTFDIKGAVAKGGKAAEEMADANRLPSGKFEQVNWFTLKDRETRIYRFLDDHDEWPSVLQHPFVPTRPAPDWMEPEAKGKWPRQFNVVCRKTPQFVQFFPDGCYICDLMHEVRPNPRGKKSKKYFPQVRLWARAVEREAVRVENEAQAEKYDAAVGEIIGFRDVEIESEQLDADGNPTGKKVMKKKIIVCNMAQKNFFSPLQGYADVYGTVCDRDYSITRKGTETDTDYDIVPLDPIEKNGARLNMRKTPEVVDGQETGRLLRDAYLDDGPDIYKLIGDRLDDDLYLRFFDDRVPVPQRDSDTKSEGNEAPARKAPSSASSSTQSASEPEEETPPAAADQNATKDRLAAMRSRVRGDNPPEQPSDDAASAQEEPEPVSAGAGGARKMVDLS